MLFAPTLADRAILPTAWRGRHFFNRIGQLLPVSATFGVTEVQEGDAELEDILKRADRALYEGKGAGRNRVMTA